MQSKLFTLLAIVASFLAVQAAPQTRRIVKQRSSFPVRTFQTAPLTFATTAAASQPVTRVLLQQQQLTPSVQYVTAAQPTLQRVQFVEQPISVAPLPVRTVSVATRGDNDDNVDFYASPKYNYRYEVVAPQYYNYHTAQEERDGNVVRGSYSVLLPNGDLQTVNYYADETGYHPTITVTPNGFQSVFGVAGPPAEASQFTG